MLRFGRALTLAWARRRGRLKRKRASPATPKPPQAAAPDARRPPARPRDGPWAASLRPALAPGPKLGQARQPATRSTTTHPSERPVGLHNPVQPSFNQPASTAPRPFPGFSLFRFLSPFFFVGDERARVGLARAPPRTTARVEPVRQATTTTAGHAAVRSPGTVAARAATLIQELQPFQRRRTHPPRQATHSEPTRLSRPRTRAISLGAPAGGHSVSKPEDQSASVGKELCKR